MSTSHRPTVPGPGYDRSKVTVGIVHFGVGGFHRAHQAMYIDRLLEQGQAFDWGICGVGVMPADAAMHTVLAAQNHLYTLVTRDRQGGVEARTVGSIVEHLYAPDDPERVLARLTAPGTRIVSLTVTEGGYELDDAVRADAARTGPPATMFGYVVEALRRRRAAGVRPFTVMSCDNIQGNGQVAKARISAFAELIDAELAAWIRAEVAFPNSMVDRITPATTPDDVRDVRERFGVDDAWPVVCEPFIQWVLEDHFGAGRPPLQDAGVQLVDNVQPYELMKLRLLNAGHQAIAYAGTLAGYTYAHEAAADPVFVEFLMRYWNDEARPTLEPVPGIDLDGYLRTLVERFANPAIRDTLARLCAWSSDRIPKWVVPVIRADVDDARPCPRAITIVASWARYAEGVDEHGNPIDVQDARRAEVMARAARHGEDELAFVRDRELFGDLVDEPAFTAPYRAALRSFHQLGARRTLQRAL